MSMEGDIGANVSDTAVFKAKLGHALKAAGCFEVLLILYLKEFL